MASKSIISPENLSEPGVVIIKHDDNNIRLFYLKSDKFREIVKKLNYRWDCVNQYWYITIGITSGDIADRLAEVGNTLLINGFAVDILDASVRDKAISGSFEPIHQKWITCIENEYCIRIPFGNNELYKSAKMIRGSHWVTRYGLMVNRASYNEVLDFAECMDYRLTPGAEALTEIAMSEHNDILKKRTAVSKPEPKSSGNKLVDKLNQTGVIDDLRDEN